MYGGNTLRAGRVELTSKLGLPDAMPQQTVYVDRSLPSLTSLLRTIFPRNRFIKIINNDLQMPRDNEEKPMQTPRQRKRTMTTMIAKTRSRRKSAKEKKRKPL
jgi:hypothetical protein